MEKNMREISPKFVVGGTIAIYIFGNFAAGLVTMIICSYLSAESAENNNFAISVILGTIIMAPLVYNLIKRGGLWRFGNFDKKNFIGFVVIAVCIAWLYQALLIYALKFFSLSSLMDAVDMQGSIGSNGNMILQVIGLAFAPAILEELVFRGALYGALRTKKGVAFSALISSLVFGVAHGLGMYTLIAFIAGLLLCAVYEATESLLAPMVVHLLNNTISIIENSNENLGAIYQSDSSLINLAVVIIIGAVTTGLCVCFLYRFRKVKERRYAETATIQRRRSWRENS